MKKLLKNRIISVLIAFIVSFTALFSLLSAGKAVFASESENPSDLNISAELGPNGFAVGETFKLKLLFTTIHTDTFWAAIDVMVGPLNAEGDDFDYDLAKKFEVDKDENGSMNIDYGAFPVAAYTNSSSDRFGFDETNKNIKRPGCFQLSLGHNYDGAPLPSETPVLITVDIKVKAEIDVDKITFGLIKKENKNSINKPANNSLNFDGHEVERFVPSPVPTLQWPVVSSNEAVIKLTPDNYLVNLDAGVSAQALETVDLTLSPASIVLDRLTTTLYVKPTFTDAAITSRIGTDKSNKVLVRHDETEPIPIPSGATKLIVHVHYNSENTEEYQEFLIDLVFTSIRLKDINVNTGTAEMTKVGLQGGFNADKFAYSVKVPDSAPSAQITATVPETEVAEEITLSAEGCTLSQTTVNSGAAFTVSEITEGATVTLTAKSTDGEITQNYRLTFGILSTDTEIKEFNIVSGELKYNNDSKKAEENSCDFYFAVKEGKNYSMLITVASTSTSKYSQIDGKTDEYIVTVTAEAGNSKDYKVILSMDSGSNTAFNILKVVDFVAVENVAVNTISCFSLPMRIINIIIWDILVPIFG